MIPSVSQGPVGLRRHARAILVPLGALPFGCVQPQVVALVVPHMACPEREVEVEWEAIGRASLRASRSPVDWDEQEVPSRGRRKLMTSQTTTFTLTALEAPRAAKQGARSATLQVPQLADQRGARTSCDESGKCRGSFTLPDVSMMRVVKLSEPTLIVQGQPEPGTICVTPPSGQRLCVAPGAGAELSTPAVGNWALEAELPTGETAPPNLRVRLDLRCL